MSDKKNINLKIHIQLSTKSKVMDNLADSFIFSVALVAKQFALIVQLPLNQHVPRTPQNSKISIAKNKEIVIHFACP